MAKLVAAFGSSHSIMLDNPAAYLGLLRPWLARQDA
jgi:proline iminopeptidase/L-proline amide hydrolase